MTSGLRPASSGKSSTPSRQGRHKASSPILLNVPKLAPALGLTCGVLLGAGLLSQASMIQQQMAPGQGQGAPSTVTASPAVQLSFNRASAVFAHPEAGWPAGGSTGNAAQGPGMFPRTFPQPPNAVTGNLSAVVKYAYAGLGHSYVWGGTSFANGWDCSGFVQWAYAQAGIALPRVSQWEALTPTTTPSPGDLVTQRPDGPHHWAHVGIYVGDGMMISALNPDAGTVLHSVGPEGTSWFFTTKALAGVDSPDSMPVAWQPPPVHTADEPDRTPRSTADRNSSSSGDAKSAVIRTPPGTADNDRSNTAANSSADERDRQARQGERHDDRHQRPSNDERRGQTPQLKQDGQQERGHKSPEPGATDKHSSAGSSKTKDKGRDSSKSKADSTDSNKESANPSTGAGAPATGGSPADDAGKDPTKTSRPGFGGSSSETAESQPEDTAEIPSTTAPAPAPSPSTTAPAPAPASTPATADLPAVVVDAAVSQAGQVMDPVTFIETVLQQAGYPQVDGPRDYLQLGVEVPAGEAQPGDLLYYPATADQPATVSVYLGDDTALQVTAAGGPVSKYTVSSQTATPVYIRLTAQP